MTGKVEVRGVILSEDVRHEANGAISIMGIASGPISSTEFPTRRRISLSLFLDAIKAGSVTLITAVLWKGEERWSVETELEVDEPGTGITLPIGGTIAGFDEPGRLSIEVRQNEKTVLTQVFDVERHDSPGT